MSTLTLDGKATAANSAVLRSEADTLRVAALALLSIRFIQGFVYRGGGSRRFIYQAGLTPKARRA
jgi:thiosulfate dehydrogenase (quinone)